jgi:hypothetical protein
MSSIAGASPMLFRWSLRLSLRTFAIGAAAFLCARSIRVNGAAALIWLAFGSVGSV